MEMDLNAMKRKQILPPLILCLMGEWTKKQSPGQDLEALGIGVEEARTQIKALVTRGLLVPMVKNRYPVETILDAPENFVEEIVLTPRGTLDRRDWNLESLKESWIRLSRGGD